MRGGLGVCMRYGSVCSGIEAATMAWHPLGWSPAFFSEIERFPSAVLAHHYGSNMPGEPLCSNGVPNLGDMTKFEEWPDYAIDLLVGGTPCQSFSVAGLRKGLADPRGNLMLTYLAIAKRYRPRWLVWENVPGVLSSNEGRDFGTFLRGLEECGYHAAWRVLDAQYVRVDGYERAVPQRRRRVFVVGYLGDWRRAAAVFLEPESLSGNPPPRREAGKGVAPTISARPTGGGGLGTDFDCDGGLIVDDAARCVTAGYAQRLDWETENFVATRDVADTLTSNGDAHSGFRDENGLVAHSLRAEGFDASEDGTGRGTPLVAFGWQNSPSQGLSDSADITPTLDKSKTPAVASWGVMPTLCRDPGGPGSQDWQQHAAVHTTSAVRRLTPRECERLQGFPDDFTNIPWRGKAEAPDGPRYKALGNSMAVNVMRWIGRRIQTVEAAVAQDREVA